jgi:AcrR family transcriptional regulator
MAANAWPDRTIPAMANPRRRAAAPPPTGDAGAALPMRQQILQLAEELYVLRGYDGFSFGHVAEAVHTTRANIHHHFGDKRQLMAELIARFASDAEQRIAHHWTRSDESFSARLQAQLDDLRLFYHRFNRSSGARNVWSPLARLRLDLPVLDQLAAGALHRIDLAYDRCLKQAVADAIAHGELVPSTPLDDVSRLLRVMLLSCAPMTQDTGDFGEIEKLFGAMERLIFAAWSRQGAA